MAATADFKWNSAKIEEIKLNMTRGLIRMGTKISEKARGNAPYKTGALRDSIRVTTDGRYTVYVLAGGKTVYVKGKDVEVNYAYLREFHNNLHPQTTHYMGRALDAVAQQDLRQYFKEIL